MAKLERKSVARKTIIYGAPKTGKTLLAGKLAEHFRLHWVDLENGYETLLQLPQAWQDNIDLIALPDTRSFPVGIETCLKLAKTDKALEICNKHGKVGCMVCKREEAPATIFDPSTFTYQDIVVYDSATQLTNSAIAHITKKMPDDYKMEWDDWFALSKLMDIFFSHIQQAPYHVIVISHENEVELKGTKKSTLVPVSGSTNFSRTVAKYFGEVIYCERKNKKHVFLSSTTSATNILAGSREDIDLEKDEVPSLLSIYKPELIGTKTTAEDNITAAEVTDTLQKLEETTTKPEEEKPVSDALTRLKNLNK